MLTVGTLDNIEQVGNLISRQPATKEML